MQTQFKKYQLDFIRPMGTSRGELKKRIVYIVFVKEGRSAGIGECAPLKGLSHDDRPGYEQKMEQVCLALSRSEELDDMDLIRWPSIRFGFETALLSLRCQNPWYLFDSAFIRANADIPINGLVVMADIEKMRSQAYEKIAQGFRCIKFKIGALDFDAECGLLEDIRSEFPGLEIRLDANGAFAAETALAKIERLADYQIHSLEQPIRPGQWNELAALCRQSPIPIALDEELIGIYTAPEKAGLLETVRPEYIVLKPSLLGGLTASETWIEAAKISGTGYWVTSMLESNVGLNALAQWLGTKDCKIPQGLGTGLLFRRNFPSALRIEKGYLKFDPPVNLPAVSSLENITLS